MNFSYEGADLNKIIKWYVKKDCEYYIQYLDGSTCKYISYNDNEEERIKQKMLNQAKERDKMYSKDKLDEIPTNNLIGALVSCVGVSISQVSELDLLKYICLFMLGFNFQRILSNKRKVKELKKYRLFLELIDELGEKELNSSKYIKAYEIDNIYSKDLNISTLDSFSLNEIQSIYKVYKSKKGK